MYGYTSRLLTAYLYEVICLLEQYILSILSLYFHLYIFSRFNHISNTTMTNVYGDIKSVIHLIDNDPPAYQYIPHADCV